MVFKFKFKIERVEGIRTLRPKIPIILSKEKKRQEITAIIDTGSDGVYIPKDFAEYFELNLSKENKTGQGAETEFQYKTSKIQIQMKGIHETYRKHITVIVPTKGANHKDIILGTDFLQDFKLELDYLKGTIKLTQNKQALTEKKLKKLMKG